MNGKIEILVTANEYLNNLEEGIKELINAFEREDYNEGSSLILLVSEGIEWIIEVINLTKDIQSEPIKIDEINEKLIEIIEAIENEDYTLISDLFKYEIFSMIENIHEKISILVQN